LGEVGGIISPCRSDKDVVQGELCKTPLRDHLRRHEQEKKQGGTEGWRKKKKKKDKTKTKREKRPYSKVNGVGGRGDREHPDVNAAKTEKSIAPKKQRMPDKTALLQKQTRMRTGLVKEENQLIHREIHQ